MNEYMVTVGLTSADPDIIARAAETFTRAAVGMALEGVEITLTIGQAEDDDAEITE